VDPSAYLGNWLISIDEIASEWATPLALHMSLFMICGRVQSLLQVSPQTTDWTVALGGVMVSMLGTGQKIHGLKPGQGRWDF
jgi:hypothetical protein